MMVMTTYLSQGCEGSVKTIRGLWLYDAIVEARVDWVPGLLINYGDSPLVSGEWGWFYGIITL